MKKSTLILLLASWSTLGCVGAEPGTSAAQRPAAPVYFVELPKTLDFAGERVPMEWPDVREALEREMAVTMYMHSRTLQTLRATKRYFPYIEQVLKQYGIPTDFKYLCMAESGLNPNVQSPAKAAGLWQFIPATAKDFGVETGENVDLRYQTEVATHAAAQYLKKAYEQYGNWTLVAASYNLGWAGVTRRADTQGVDNYYDLFLPEETMRYVYRILSMKLVSENPVRYGFVLREQDYLQPFKNYKEVTISDAQIDWSEFAQRHGTNYKMLRVLNPWIRSYEYTNKSQKDYVVKIPTGDFRQRGY